MLMHEKPCLIPILKYYPFVFLLLELRVRCRVSKNSLRSITKTRLFKYLEIFTSKKQKISDKNLIFFSYSAQNIDCGYPLEPPRQGGSNVYPQSIFLSRNKKNNEYPCKPQFYYIKVGFKGVKII